MLKLFNLKGNISLYTKVLLILPILFLGLSFISNKVSAFIETPSKCSLFCFVDPEAASVLSEQAFGTDCVQDNGQVGVYSSGMLTNTFISINESIGRKGGFSEFTCDVTSDTTASLYDNEENEGAGVIDMLNNVNVALLDQRPLSAEDFIQDKVYALTGTVQAETTPAQYFPGTGYQLLEPIQAFWGWSVNVVFAFLILIIIGIALAIVFRQNIGGAQMVTIQNAIPSIAMALILVPLSYSISGVFIDAITFGTNAVHQFFFGVGAPARDVYNAVIEAGDAGRTDGCTNTTDNSCNRGLYADDYRLDWWNFRNLVDVSDEVEGVANTSIAGQGINSLVLMDIIKRVLDLLAGSSRPAAYWFGEIVNTIFGILMIWIGIKIAIRLFKKYLTLVLTPIVSPFIFASVAVPGNSTKAIVNYLKMMGAASLFYIVTYLMFVLTFVFTSEVFNDQLPNFSKGLYVPPLLGLREVFDALPTGSSRSLINLLFAFIGLGIYFSIPKVLDDIDNALGQKFILPAFLKTPFESLQESFKVTRGASARALQLTSRGGVGLVRNGRNLRFNMERLRDKMIGRSDSDSESAVFKRKQSNLIRRQGILSQLDELEGESSPEAMRKRAELQTQLALIDADEALQGKEYSSKAEEGKTRELKAEISYNSGGTYFNLDFGKLFSVYDNLYSHVGRMSKKKVESIPLGVLMINAENLSLDKTESVTIASTMKSDKNLDIYDKSKLMYDKFMPLNNETNIGGDRVFGLYESGTVYDYFELQNGTQVYPSIKIKGVVPVPATFEGGIRIRAGFKPAAGAYPNTFDVKNNKTIIIPLNLVIDSNILPYSEFVRLFGEYVVDSRTFKGGVFNDIVQTPKVAFKITSKNLTTIGIQVQIKKSTI